MDMKHSQGLAEDDTIRMRLSPMEKQVMEFETMRWLLWTYDEVECLIQSLFVGSAEGFRPGGLMEPSAKCWIPFVSKIGTDRWTNEGNTCAR